MNDSRWKSNSRAFIAVVIVALATLTGCRPEKSSLSEARVETKAIAMAHEITIKVGEMGPALKKRYPNSVKFEHQPAGVDFYSIDWDARPRGIITIDHKAHSFLIRDALGLQAMQDLGPLEMEGLYRFTIFSGISDPDLIHHDQARIKTYAILRQIMDAGWRQVVERSEPRLNGKARQDHMFATSNLNGLDATYMPTFEDWMRVESRTPWSFYADGVFLTVEFTRERTLTDPAKPGSYLLTFNFQTATEYFRGYAGPDNRFRWRELLPQELMKVAKLRLEKETELRAKGVPIDESYEDPPIPAR